MQMGIQFNDDGVLFGLNGESHTPDQIRAKLDLMRRDVAALERLIRVYELSENPPKRKHRRKST